MGYFQNPPGPSHDNFTASLQSMAIVANGDVHPAISSGQFVYVREHSTLSEGLYKASSSIAQDATLSTSNLTAVSGGGMNSLNEQMANNTYINSGLTPSSGCSIVNGGYCVVGKVVIVNMRISKTTSYNVTISGLPAPSISTGSNYVSVFGYDATNEKVAFGYISSTGQLNIPSAYISEGNILLSCVYVKV